MKKRHGSSFANIFITFSLIGIFLIISFISYIFISTKDSVLENIINSKITSTNQIKNTFEREIQTIEKSFNAYSTSPSFLEMVQKPLQTKDFKQYREINSQLNYFSIFSLPGTNYSMTSLEGQWRIREGSLQQMTKEDINQFENYYVKERTENLYWIKGEDSIISVSLLPIFSTHKSAIGMAEIPNQSIYSLLEISNATTPFFIINRNDEIIYSANISDEIPHMKEEIISNLKIHAEKNNTGIIKNIDDQNKDSNFIFTKSDYNQWIYVTFLDHQEIDSALSVSKYGLSLLAIILIFSSIGGSYFLAFRFTKPIEKLKNSLNYNPSRDKKENDWEFISESINTIVTEKKSLENLYERDEPELKKQFMLNLYRNRIIRSELENKMKLYQYPLEDKQTYGIMLIQLDDYGDREIKNKDIFLFGINEMVKELIPTELRLTPIVLNDEIQVTMLIFKEDTFEQNKKIASEYARTIIKTLKDYMKISVSISFSPFYDHLLESQENLDKGKEALTYHLILGKQAVIFYHEVEELLAIPEISQYPEELENNLFQSIRLGEVDKANVIAPTFLEKIFTSSNNPINVQVALLRFVLNLTQLSQSMKSEFLTEEQGVELYEIILNTHNPSELEFTLIKDLILPLVEEMSEKNSQQFKGLSEQIIEIIENEYMEDISLELIGDRLHYNPNYLSNIFKKEVGITFSDYLTGFRFDIAKKWLRETDLTIKVISQKLQYRNPQNFIRSFKKKENMTPGEYRKMHIPL